MKLKFTSMIGLSAAIGIFSIYAKTNERPADTPPPALDPANPKVTIEVNGKKIDAGVAGATITIRTDGSGIEIDTDGDGEAEQQLDVPPAAAGQAQDDAGITPAPARKEFAWLGVKSNDVSPELACQLDLPGGAVVEMIVPDSPAALAGLQDHDVITHIGDTEVATPEELSHAIRALKPGAATTVGIVRKAKPMKLEATLGTRPQMPQLENQHALPDFDLRGEPEEIRKRIENIQREMLEGLKLRLDGQNLPNLDLKDLGKGADIVRMSSKTTSFSDGDGSITITTENGETQIEAKDADGNVLYSGPAETEEDRKKLPPEVLEKLERFEEMNLNIEMKGFEDKILPPSIDLPELKPAEPKKPSGD